MRYIEDTKPHGNRIENLVERLRANVDKEIAFGSDPDDIDWNYEAGILISIREAQIIITAFQYLTDEEIEKASLEEYGDGTDQHYARCGFRDGCRWIREKLESSK